MSADLFDLAGEPLPPPRKSNLVCTISACERYRYDLGEIWDEYRPLDVHVLCNPSIAEFVSDPPKWDPTATRIKERAVRQSFTDSGCGGWVIVNPYALRSTNPKALLTEPLRFGGPDQRSALDRWLRAAWMSRGRIIVGWGDAMPKPLRDEARDIVLDSVPCDGPVQAPLWCYGLTGSGQPRHPLMLAYSTPLRPWSTS